MGTVVTLRGEGGSEWQYELPLNDLHAEKVAKGELRPADAESEKALAAGTVNAKTPESDLTLEERVDAVGSHAEANTLAEELGVEGFKAKSPGLDAKKAALKAKADELAADDVDGSDDAADQ